MATDLDLGPIAEGCEPAPAREVFTLAQFLTLPEIKPAPEFVRGRVVQKASPNLHHSLLEYRLPARLNAFAEPAGLGLALPELRVSFGGESYVPDVSFFAAGRLPLSDEGEYGEDVFLPPDLSIEILSPGQTVKQLTARLNRLIRKGLRLGWLIQPGRARVLVVEDGRQIQELAPGAILVGDPVLPGFTLPIDELFGWLKPARR